MNMVTADAVSPAIIGGVALGFLVLVAIGVFILLSIVAFVRKKYSTDNQKK
jgi:uncharacterized protein (DUF2062 family)